jgi:DNA-binding NarL/FixJ family response regulator
MRAPRRIVICEDHKIVRDGLTLLLEQTGRYRIAGQASTGHELPGALHRSQPDLLILDLNLPDCEGFDLLISTRQQYPNLLIVILTMYTERVFVKRAAELGANGYLLKNCDNQELLDMLDHIVLNRFRAPEDTPATREPHLEDGFQRKAHLTKRELEIIRFICQGLSSQQMADRLFLSPFTIDTHRKNIIRKTGVSSLVELINFAHENRLV